MGQRILEIRRSSPLAEWNVKKIKILMLWDFIKYMAKAESRGSFSKGNISDVFSKKYDKL